MKSGHDGIARFPELPGAKQEFGLDHKAWELPINQSHTRSESLAVVPQETNHYVLKVQPKGKEFREE
jgi:hypothetical protein